MASAALMTVGFVLGACIRGSNTMVPAHYHAAIGAVSVAYMALAFRVLAALGRPVPAGRPARLAALQPAIFGAGQTVFAIGFAIAGNAGMGRKMYGAEQHARTAAQTAGLAVMGLGGLVAVLAGVLFLWVVAKALRAQVEGETSWPTASIRSRS
jgi:heme/copper-type cytochrome/quinol oxidase subunit 1